MSDQDFNDNTGTAEVEDGAVDGTAGVEDEDAAASMDIHDPTVPTRRPHPDRRTREARQEAVHIRSVSAAPASSDISPAAVRPAASSMAMKLAVPPCMSDETARLTHEAISRAFEPPAYNTTAASSESAHVGQPAPGLHYLSSVDAMTYPGDVNECYQQQGAHVFEGEVFWD